MSLGTTRFSAPTAAGSNAKKRHTAIFVLTVAAHPRSGSIIYPSPASRTANISSRAAFTWQRGRVQFTRAASSDAMVHCSRLTLRLSGRGRATRARGPLKPDVRRPSSGHARSFDHLIRAEQERRRDREAQRLGGPQVDHELELRGLLDRQVGRLGAFEDLVYVRCRAPVQIWEG